MRRTVCGAGAVLACAAALAPPPPAAAWGYGMPSPMMGFLRAECVAAGRVIGFEDLNVAALPHPRATERVEYKIAVVRVTQGLRGVSDAEQLRVGLFPTQKLQAGQEVLLFLASHHDEPFYVMQDRYEYGLSREMNAKEFDNQVAQYRKLARILSDPGAALKAKDPQERLQAAIFLVNAHRTFRPDVHRADRRVRPLDAEQSRLVL